MLRRRAESLREAMDEPGCEPVLLNNTYAQFARVNRLVSGWPAIFRRHVLPALPPRARLLDIGCGAGDLARSFRLDALRHGVDLEVVGIDTDPRAVAFARRHRGHDGVEFRLADGAGVLSSGERFDAVVSNHLLHHLPAADLPGFLDLSRELARRVVVHNDLRRDPLAVIGFAFLAPLFPRSFIVADGFRSIRRSYRPEELRAVLGGDWRVERATPYRNVVLWKS